MSRGMRLTLGTVFTIGGLAFLGMGLDRRGIEGPADSLAIAAFCVLAAYACFFHHGRKLAVRESGVLLLAIIIECVAFERTGFSYKGLLVAVTIAGWMALSGEYPDWAPLATVFGTKPASPWRSLVQRRKS